jgi:hypothetical protein
MVRVTARAPLTIALLAFLVLATSAPARAQAPRTISYQGILTDAAGTLVPDGNHALALTLYDAASGGVALFAETQTVPVVRGTFGAILGSATTGGIPATVAFDRAYFLGVSVDSAAELAPRVPLTAVPYALRAAVADAVEAGSVHTASVAGAAITSDKLAAGAVASANVADGAIAGVKLADGAVSVAKLVDGAVSTAKLADGSVTMAKLSGAGGADGQALTWSAGAVTFAEPTLKLRYAGAGTTAANEGAFAITGNHAGLEGLTTGTGSLDAGVLGKTSGGNAIGVYGLITGGARDSLAMFGRNDGAAGTGGLFQNTSAANPYAALQGASAGSGPAIQAYALGSGAAFEANSGSGSPDVAVFKRNGVNVARIDSAGIGYFNGGTQNSGADVAEAFEVAGGVASVEPGDVLVIATTRDRAVERSRQAFSTRVAGVYATKPGVLLTEWPVADPGQAAQVDPANPLDPAMPSGGVAPAAPAPPAMVPLGIVGVIPTKVTAENGAIRAGDLLVTAATPGHAMKAGTNPPMGSVLGKALEGFDAPEPGRIRVLVGIR